MDRKIELADDKKESGKMEEGSVVALTQALFPHQGRCHSNRLQIVRHRIEDTHLPYPSKKNIRKQSHMDIEYKIMKLTCVGLGVAGTAVPEVMVVGCPEVPRHT